MSKTKLLQKNNLLNTGVNLKMIGEKVLGLKPIKMEAFILDSIRIIKSTGMEFINIITVMFIKDNIMMMKNRDTAFIKGITEMSMMDSGKITTDQM
jgi:hypothetical protein